MTPVTFFATVRPVQWLWLVPDPLATQFDVAGNPDGFSSPASNIALTTHARFGLRITQATGEYLKSVSKTLPQ